MPCCAEGLALQCLSLCNKWYASFFFKLLHLNINQCRDIIKSFIYILPIHINPPKADLNIIFIYQSAYLTTSYSSIYNNIIKSFIYILHIHINPPKTDINIIFIYQSAYLKTSYSSIYNNIMKFYLYLTHTHQSTQNWHKHNLYLSICLLNNIIQFYL